MWSLPSIGNLRESVSMISPLRFQHDGVTPLRRNNNNHDNKIKTSSSSSTVDTKGQTLLQYRIKPMIHSIYTNVISRVDQCAKNCPCFHNGADKSVMHDTSIPLELSSSGMGTKELQQGHPLPSSSSRFATFDSDGTFPLLPTDGFVYGSTDREGSPSDVRLNPYYHEDSGNIHDDNLSSSTVCHHQSCPQPGERLDSVRKNLMTLLLDDNAKCNVDVTTHNVCTAAVYRTATSGMVGREPRFDISSSSEVQTIQESQFVDTNDPFVVSLSIG